MRVILLSLALAAPSPQAGLQGPSRIGWEAIQNGEPEKAASAFREALSANPRDALSQAGAGVAAHLLGREDEALRSLKKALELNPDLSYASYMLGQVAYAQGDLDLAIRSLERALKASPGSRTLAAQIEQWKKEAALHDTFVQRPGARFTILFEGPAQKAVADRVNAVLEQAYVRIGRTLNEYPPETITAILYTKQQFRDITRSPSWAAGVYDGRIRIGSTVRTRSSRMPRAASPRACSSSASGPASRRSCSTSATGRPSIRRCCCSTFRPTTSSANGRAARAPNDCVAHLHKRYLCVRAHRFSVAIQMSDSLVPCWK